MNEDAAGATAPSQQRDVLIDAARAISVVMVIVFHAGLWRVTLTEGEWKAQTMELGPLGWIGSWFVMVMPLFFLCGGYAHALVVDKMHARGTGLAHYLANRGRRLLGPTIVFIGLFSIPATLAAWLGFVDQAVFVSHNLTKLLWFLVAYLFTVALAPFFVAAHDRSAWTVPLALTAAALVVDLTTMAVGILDLRYFNLFFVWLACHQIGIAHQRGFLRRGPRHRVWVAIGLGAASVVVLVALGWPETAVGMGSKQVSNLQPPTVAMIAVCLAQAGVLGLLSRRPCRWLHRPRVQQAIGLVNALTMTLYLWHMPVVVLVFGFFIGVGMLVPALVPVLTLPLATLPVVVPLLALLVPWVARLDLRMIPPLGAWQHGRLAAVAMVLLTASLALVWRSGLVVHPRAPISSLGVIGTACGAWMLARASNWGSRSH